MVARMRRRITSILIFMAMLAVLALPALAQETADPASTAPQTAPPDAASAGPVARGVFFFSPTCPHCELVINDHLPGIFSRFGGPPTVAIDESISPADVAFYLMSNGTLQLLMVDVSVDPGAQMFVTDSDRLGIAQAGVPRLDIGDQYMVGSVDIPERLPGLVETGLAGDGIAWPQVPGLAVALTPFPAAGEIGGDGGPSGGTELVLPTADLGVWERVSRDLLGNGIAILVLAALLASLVAVPTLLVRGSFPDLPVWPVPLLAVLGIAVSAYLGSVESSGAEVVCGPVGDCNAVQQSGYSSVMGVPIGVLGVIGYALLLAGWIVAHLVRGRMADAVLIGLAGGAFAGTLFSAYLTFLEPFVIGATCAWCITSALTMLGLLWLTAAAGWAALGRIRGPMQTPRREGAA